MSTIHTFRHCTMEKALTESSLMSTNSTMSNTTTSNLPRSSNPFYQPPTSSEVFGYYVGIIAAPILLVIGIVGNILSIIVFSRKGLHGTITSLLFRALAICDILSLFEISEKLFLIWDIDTIQANKLSCQVCFYFIWVVKTCAAWMLVFISVERCIGIYKPHMAKLICTKQRAKIAIGLLIVSAMVIYAPFLKLYGVHHCYRAVLGREVPFCVRPRDILPVYNNVAPWFELVFYSLAPFVFILILNIAISVRLIISQQRRNETLNVDSGADSNMHGLTAMLLTTSTAFMVLTLPFCMYYLLRKYSVITKHNPQPHFKDIALVMQQTYHAINFFIYCFSGPRFRRELKTVFCQPQSSQSTGNTLDNHSMGVKVISDLHEI